MKQDPYVAAGGQLLAIYFAEVCGRAETPDPGRVHVIRSEAGNPFARAGQRLTGIVHVLAALAINIGALIERIELSL